MDFDVDQTRGLRFGYVLPVSPCEALVENVYLADVPVTEAEHRAELESYLESRFGLESGDYEILGDERGCIPMTDHVFNQRPVPRVSVIGTLGGATRPSTGYTFLRIQRSSDETALRLLGDSPEDGRTHTSRSSMLDRVFLRFLADHPERAPLVFARMFARVPADSLVRFLSDRSGPIDIARLILALPKRWFLGSALLVVLRLAADGVRHDRRN
jgi:lycopene beta-cyclase